jgi:hypothetical protein
MSVGAFWDERFATPGYAYGDDANDFLVEVTPRLPKGRALSLGEGEGRNARQLAHGTGGPKDPALLYDVAMLRADLDGLDFTIAHEVDRSIHEGVLHHGPSSVVQILAYRR